MKLQFERFLQSQSFPTETVSLAEEGIKCYKVGAYRASFLMSYYFFLKVLKYRLEQSKDYKPSGLESDKWIGILRNIKKDDTWDSIVYSTTQQKDNDGRSVIYLTDDSTRIEMTYWKKIRNDCAHSKDSIISHSHVESFWLFIESNLQKFIVNGGKEALLDKIKRHFNPTYTEPGQSYSFIIDQLPLVVDKSEMSDLLLDIHLNIKDIDKYRYIDDEGSVFYYFWRDIAFSENQDIQRAFIDFITNDMEIFIDFITVYPELLYLCLPKEIIRPFWKEQFFTRHIRYVDSFWKLATTLLQHDVIDKEERSHFVYQLAVKGNLSILEPNEIIFFKESGLFEALREYLFIDDKLTRLYVGYNNANSLSTKIMFYLKHCEVDTEVVSTLNSLLYKMNRGRFLEDFKRFIEGNEPFKEQFKKIVSDNGLNLASVFNESTD